MEFLIAAEPGNLERAIRLTSTNTEITRYFGHPFGSPQVTASKTSTLARENKDECDRYPNILSIFQLTITFPFLSSLQLNQNIPQITFTKGINPLGSDILYLYPTSVIIVPDIVKNTTIEFSITDIINPYCRQISCFKIDIYDKDIDFHEFESFPCQFNVSIDKVGGLNSVSLQLTGTKTSELGVYNFSVELGYGSLNTSTDIELTVDQAIKDCDETSFQAVSGFTTNIIDKYKTQEKAFGFAVPCDIASLSLIVFSIQCTNPETTRRTSNFTITARLHTNNDKEDIYFFTGESLQINDTNNFTSVEYDIASYFTNHNTVFNFTIVKSSTINSTDINIINIVAASSLQVYSSLSCDNYIGFTGTPKCIITETNTILIDNFTKLSHTFGFRLVGIRTPSTSTEPLYFIVKTLNSESYISEEFITPHKYMLCDFPCKTCETGESTKCTQCYPNTASARYLLNNLTKICDLVGDFETSSTINITGGDLKIGQNAFYTFKLRPNGTLDKDSGVIEIYAPPVYNLGVNCNVNCTATTDCTCSIAGRVIAVRSFLEENYDSATTAEFIQFVFYDTIDNPLWSYAYDNCADFKVFTLENGIYKHESDIGIKQTGRFEPFQFTATSIGVDDVASTSTKLKITFQMKNEGYAIYKDSVFRIQFPHTIAFDNDNVPILASIRHELPSNATIIYKEFPYIMISAHYETDLPSSSGILFAIDNIITPYSLGRNYCIYITTSPDELAESTEINQFVITTPTLCLSITQIAPFSATSITSSSYMTSTPATYIFSLTTRFRGLNSAFKITIGTPSAISNCNMDSITSVAYMPQIMMKSQCDDHCFGFEIPSEIPKLTKFKFSILCDNPETIRPTDSFVLEAVNKSSGLATYHSDLILTMNELNVFHLVEISSSNQYPGQLTNYTFKVTKTRQASSFDITVISVYFVPDNMIIPTISYEITAGITGESLTLYIVNNKARISKITELSEYFEFTLLGIINPYTRDEQISVVISTTNEEEYHSEETTKDMGFMPCNYPCQTCPCRDCPNKDECLSCPSDMYLLDVECVYSCPVGYYSNIINSICEELSENILGFVSAQIMFIDNNIVREINKVSGYRFKLQPDGELSKDASIEITKPLRMGIDKSCSIRGVSGISCSILNTIIIINGFIESNYSSEVDGEITFDIYVFVNPRWTYKYDIQEFQIFTTFEGGLLHGVALNLTNAGRFLPHQFTDVSMTPTHVSTASLVSITINLTNSDSAVDTNNNLYIKFPSSMQYKGFPELTVISGLASSPFVKEISPVIIVEDILKTKLVQGSIISFTISNILTPLSTGISESIQVEIGVSEDLKQFVATTGLTLSVDTVSTLGSVSVTPSSFMTCERANYVFIIQIGERDVDTNYQIRFKIPESVTQCNHSSIYDELGSNLPEKEDLGDNYFAFHVPEKLDALSSYAFGIRCTNPETRKPTGNFQIQIESIDTGDPCYNHSGNSISMQNANDFETVEVEFSNQSPASLSNITLTITKSIEVTSKDINMIIINLNSKLIIDTNIFDCEFLSGITGDHLSCQFTGEIVFEGINELSQTFSLNIKNIQTPDQSGDIDIKIYTMYYSYENEYDSEFKRILWDFPCDLPCKTCSEQAYKCTECFTLADLNYIGDGGSIQNMFYEDLNKCYVECPSHTINTTDNICEKCHICSQCSVILTNCTECYEDIYIHNYECLNSCPPGYFGNTLEWKCVVDGIFMEGTQLQIMGDDECDHLGEYIFKLMPVGTLDMTSTLEITIPEQMRLELMCIINIGDCTINTSTNTLIITNMLTSNYNSNSEEYIIVNISDTIHNPSYSVSMELYNFGLKTIIGTVVKHTGNLKSTTQGKYKAHAFGIGSSVSCPVQSTVTETSLTFTLFTTEYEIDIACSIYIKFPLMMTFTSPDPEIVIHKGVDISTTYISRVAFPAIYISGGFQSKLPPNQEIQFTINNILTPYVKNTRNRFVVEIYKKGYLNIYIGFDEFEVNIKDESIIPFIVTPSSFMTCARAIYEFSVQVGDGSLNPSHLVQVEIPESIIECEHPTIIQIQGINYPITITTVTLFIFEFWIPTKIEKLKIIKFVMKCNNPESTAPTDNFYMSIRDTENNIFYKGTANSIAMTHPNSFQSAKFTMNTLDPLERNSFLFEISRSYEYKSSVITGIRVEIDPPMNFLVSNVEVINGISTMKNPNIWYIDLLIDIIQDFSFKIVNVLNPKYATDNITFTISTLHESPSNLEYISESITLTQNLPCGFPCKKCYMTSFLCSECFSQGDSIFDGEIAHEYLFYEINHQCVSICPNSFPLPNDTCGLCAELTYYYEGVCENECPLDYYSNNLERVCQKCYESCRSCNSTLKTGCVTCFADILHLDNGECISECPLYTFFNDTTNECQDCHEDCLKCRGSTSHDCESCRMASHMRFNSDTHSCCPNGYYSQSFTCYKCDESCKECSGPTNTECLINECNRASNYHPLKAHSIGNKHSTCIFECHSKPPLFFNNNTKECEYCHTNCAVCDNISESDCFECNSPYLLTQGRECIYTNCDALQNSFEGEGGCQDCDQKCDGCHGSQNLCLGCVSPYFFMRDFNSCLDVCPQSYFGNIYIFECQKCPLKCLTCNRINNTSNQRNISESNFICTSCDIHYFLYEGTKCVSETNCGAANYPDIESRTCKRCNRVCEGCTGPTFEDCTKCIKGYYMTEGGACLDMVCELPNQYLDQSFICQNCHPNCKRCKEAGPNNCLECKPPLLPDPTTSTLSCIPCSKLLGMEFKPNPDEGCQEICGDGLNLGFTYECDDGNRNNGDGCSETCVVEDGYSCEINTEVNKPDKCRDIVSPKIDIGFQHPVRNIIFFQFNEPVFIATKTNLTQLIEITITGDLPEYNFDFSVQATPVSNQESTRRNLDEEVEVCEDNSDGIFELFEITIKAKSSILEGDVANVILNATAILDIDGNSMNVLRQFNVKLHQFNYIDQAEKESVKGIGNTILIAMIGTLSINVALAIVCSSSLSMLIPLFNLIQLISLIPLLEIILPENLRMFISEYLMFSHFQFGFLYNPLHRVVDMSDVMNKPYSKNFEDNGVSSQSFVVNFGGQLVIWMITIIAYIVICLLYKVCKKERLHKMKQAFEYGIFNTLLVEGYIISSLLSILNLNHMGISTQAELISTIFGSIGIMIALGYPILVLHTISRRTYKLTSEVCLRRYGSLYSSTQYNRTESLCQLYIIFFLMRRLLYIGIIIFLKYSATAQQILNIILHLGMCIWNYKNKPFGTKSRIGILIHSFDYFVFILFAGLPIFFIRMSPSLFAIFGLIYISAICLVILVSWVIIIIDNIKIIREKIYIWKEKRKAKREEEELELKRVEKEIKDDEIAAELQRMEELENQVSSVKLKKYRKIRRGEEGFVDFYPERYKDNVEQKEDG